MARSRMPKFDASEVITFELIRIIERGILPWRKPWTAGGSSRPLRVSGEPYQGVNNFLLTMRTVMAGHSSPFWMTLPQANALEAKVRKGEKSSVVVYYGQSRKDADSEDNRSEDNRSEDDDRSEEARMFRFQKSYRVFNACQIEGLPDSFFPTRSQRPSIHPRNPSRTCRRFSMRSTSRPSLRAIRPTTCRPWTRFTCRVLPVSRIRDVSTGSGPMSWLIMPRFGLCRACSDEVLFPAAFVVFRLHKTAVQDRHVSVAICHRCNLQLRRKHSWKMIRTQIKRRSGN